MYALVRGGTIAEGLERKMGGYVSVYTDTASPTEKKKVPTKEGKKESPLRTGENMDLNSTYTHTPKATSFIEPESREQ